MVGRGSLKGRDIEIEAGPVPRLKQWSFVRIPSSNRIGFHQQRRVEIQDGTAAKAMFRRGLLLAFIDVR